MGQNRTLFTNSILSTSILSIAFFLFLTINLYRGVKLKDNLGKITDNIDKDKLSKIPNINLSGDSVPSIDGDGIGGIIIGILAWILISIILLLLIWILGALLWVMVLLFAAMLYWIFYRALRYALKHSKQCKGYLTKSMGYGLLYTVVYNSWIYGIILASHYLIK